MRRSEAKVNWLKVAAVVFAVIFVVSGGLLAINIWERQHGKYAENAFDASSESITYDGEEYTLKSNVETVLLMGLDKYEGTFESDSYNNDRQADFMLLLIIDNASKTCKALQINRDTMVEMNMLGVAGDKIGTTTKQIALSHTYGNGEEVSCRNAADAVSKLLLGVEIDHYVSATMDVVPMYTDMLGGVEVTVLDDFTGIDDTLVKGETVNLKGEHALTYVRTREGLSDATNEHRMERQRQFIEAAYRETVEKADEDSGFITSAAIKLSPYTVSDCSVERIQGILEKVSSYQFDGTYGIEGESVKGEVYMEFYPDADSIEKTVIDLFYNKKQD